MRDLTIIPTEGKGRSFRATMLAYATSRSLWAAGDSTNVRPIFAMLATTDAESMPFIRNLQGGRKAKFTLDRDDLTFECLKSAAYQYDAQRHPEGVVWTVYLPELYRIDPGMVDPSAVRFAVAPADKWLGAADEALAKWLLTMYREDLTDAYYRSAERQAESDAKRLAVLTYVTRVAPLFAAYLDRRTRCPLIPDPRFYSLVLAAMLDAGQARIAGGDSYSRDREWARGGFDYIEWCVAERMGVGGIACSTTHAALEPLLAKCVRVYEASAFKAAA